MSRALSGLGTQYTGLALATIDSAALWTLAGANSITASDKLVVSGTLTNDGTIVGGVGTTGTYTSGSNFGTGGRGVAAVRLSPSVRAA